MINGLLLKVYNGLPILRPVFASVYGYKLRHDRYGGTSERLVLEALEREKWSPQQWKSWRETLLAKTLHCAAKEVPYYRQHWTERRRRGDSASVEILENWPILEKDDIRANLTSLIAEGTELQNSEYETTSGTTGQPLTFLLTQSTVRAWYALCEARFRKWNGVTRHDRWALIGAQAVVPVTQKRPPFWVWNGGLNQLYMSACHLYPNRLGEYLDALHNYGIVYLWGHSSVLEVLAREILRQGRSDLQFRVVLTTSEPLSRRQRHLLSAAFRCPVRETYGMCEMMAAASECEHGHLHLWPEVAWYEIVSGNSRTLEGEAGDLVATSFLNSAMPLIRYRVGDRAVLKNPGEVCPCGRTLPLLEGIDGRSSDILFNADGRQISPASMEAVFDIDIPILEGQIIQEELGRIRVRYVPDAGWTAATESILIERIRQRMGMVAVEFEAVSHIERGPNHKFRAVLCRLPAEDLRNIKSRRTQSDESAIVPVAADF